MKRIAFVTKKRNDAVGLVEENLLRELKIENNKHFKIDIIIFPYVNSAYSILYLFKHLIKIISIYREYDIIHYSSFDIYIIIFQPILKLVYRKKTILTVFHLEIDFINYVLNKLGLYKTILKSFDSYICISEYSKSQLMKININRSKIYIARLGVEGRYFYPSSNKKNNFQYILFVGDEYPRKNLMTLLYTLKKIIIEYPKLKFIKIGEVKDKSHREATDKLINDLVLSKNTIFIRNKVSLSSLREYYSKALFLVSASTIEGFGLPVLEAMRCKCLPVVSGIKAFKEFDLPKSLYVNNPLSVNQWVKKIKLILSFKIEQKIKLQNIVYKNSLNYSWKKMATQVTLVYSSL